MKSKVNIIVLNWNGANVLSDCLESLSILDYPNYNIFVIDNNSSDDSLSKIRKYFPKVKTIELDKNYGYAEGNNRGFKSLLNYPSDFTMFINNDTVVDKNFLAPLIEPLENDINIVQTVPKIFYYKNKHVIWYAGGKVNKWLGVIQHRGIRSTDIPKYNDSQITGYATGCCFAMRTKDFNTIGGFDTTFPMYCEDVDLSLRLRNEGKVIQYIPQSVIYHKVSASIGGELSKSKIWKKIQGTTKLFWRHTNFLQKISILISWILLVPIYFIKYVYLKLFYNDK